ncbi:hypothetical protein QUB70_12440 [Microcoleus sp. A003_D6]|uniref:hypothetical protein n=1 Tax=Microcoleus sp. A003_D6 TaxID=3055266 RepID=UPI002FCF42FF
MKLYFREMANCVVCEKVRSRKPTNFREICSRQLRGGLTLSRIYPGGFLPLTRQTRVELLK